MIITIRMTQKAITAMVTKTVKMVMIKVEFRLYYTFLNRI